MKTFYLKGYTVTIFETYDGDKVFIEKDGIQIYAHRVMKGEGLERAKFVIGKQQRQK